MRMLVAVFSTMLVALMLSNGVTGLLEGLQPLTDAQLFGNVQQLRNELRRIDTALDEYTRLHGFTENSSSDDVLSVEETIWQAFVDKLAVYRYYKKFFKTRLDLIKQATNDIAIRNEVRRIEEDQELYDLSAETVKKEKDQVMSKIPVWKTEKLSLEKILKMLRDIKDEIYADAEEKKMKELMLHCANSTPEEFDDDKGQLQVINKLVYILEDFDDMRAKEVDKFNRGNVPFKAIKIAKEHKSANIAKRRIFSLYNNLFLHHLDLINRRIKKETQDRNSALPAKKIKTNTSSLETQKKVLEKNIERMRGIEKALDTEALEVELMMEEASMTYHPPQAFGQSMNYYPF